MPLTGGYRYDTENAVYASWWLIDEGTNGDVTLFNQSDQDIVISPSIIVAGTEHTSQALTLRSRHTSILNIRQFLHDQGIEATSGSIALRYSGPAHALNPALLLANPSTGFSLLSSFNARHEKLEGSEVTWRFPDVFLSSDASFGFNKDEQLTAYALVSNPLKTAMLPRLTAFVGGIGQLQAVSLPPIPLKPLETRLVNLSKFVESGLLPRNLTYMSLAVSHDGAPGDLGLTVFSVGQTKDFVSRSEGLVRSGQVIDSTYWDIAGNLEALLVVQNATQAPVQSKATLYYQSSQGMASYTLLPIDVPGNGSHILNLKQIIRAGIPDFTGNVIPASVTFGTLTLEVTDKNSHGLVFGGSVTFDPVKGRYGEGAFPPNCDLCDICEVCVEATEEGGICDPDCSDPTCCSSPPLPVPAFFSATIADPLITADCSLNTLGSGFTVHYQVLDQNGIHCRWAE